jgi:hypothetical protein
MKPLAQALRGIKAAVGARPWLFAAMVAGVFLTDILLPPLLLSVVRKPMSSFTINPWLKNFPEWVSSGAVPLQRKIEFFPRLALFWFRADAPIEPEWGFAVTVSDLFRFVLMGVLIAAYFVLWLRWREGGGSGGWRVRTTRQGGVAGALVSTLGLSTGPCTVTGCGAPVMPVIGLAFAGLSSSTITWMSEVSTLAVWVVMGALAVGVVYLGWRVGGVTPRR